MTKAGLGWAGWEAEEVRGWKFLGWIAGCEEDSAYQAGLAGHHSAGKGPTQAALFSWKHCDNEKHSWALSNTAICPSSL